MKSSLKSYKVTVGEQVQHFNFLSFPISDSNSNPSLLFSSHGFLIYSPFTDLKQSKEIPVNMRSLLFSTSFLRPHESLHFSVFGFFFFSDILWTCRNYLSNLQDFTEIRPSVYFFQFSV
ncbi:hypothetical protein VNO80_08600 [Phaseolus coccineus]|uniref:Uncharacterized protein n=1 Tax=Phaseolus coccineus TaxID=3886 RepID=A0AAN9R8S1_PHACN